MQEEMRDGGWRGMRGWGSVRSVHSGVCAVEGSTERRRARADGWATHAQTQNAEGRMRSGCGCGWVGERGGCANVERALSDMYVISSLVPSLVFAGPARPGPAPLHLRVWVSVRVWT